MQTSTIAMAGALSGMALSASFIGMPSVADHRGRFLFEANCGACHSPAEMRGYTFEDIRVALGPRTVHATIAELSDRDLKQIAGYLSEEEEADS